MRRNTALTRIMASDVAAIMLCAGGTFTVNAAEEEPVKADVSVKAIQGLSDDFIGGMDVSSMLSLEESGVTFKNANGEVEDLFTLLKESGVNYVRLRVWNDPFTADGQGYGGGNVNADRALTMAKRATAAGLKVLVDFHYSDFWADPSKQQVPKAWKSFEGDADKTADTVYDYTKQTLTTFKQAGVDVGMVQVGNETTAKIAGISGWDGMSKVFSAGSKAIREVLPEAKVVIHFTNPEKAGTYATYAKQLSNHNVDKVSLVKKTETPVKPSTENLDKAVAEAGKINRDEYTNESLAKLDQALAAADVLLAGSTYTEQDVNDVIKLVADAIAGLAQKEVSSLTVTPSKTTYQVGDAIDADHDLKVVGNYSAGMGNVTLSADQFTLDYDFSAPADAAKVTVTLKSDPNVTETYTVAVTARAEGGSGNGSDGAGNGGATINPDTGEGDKTNGANGDKITGVLSNTGSAVTAVGLAVVVLGVAGGVSLALRRKRS